MKTPKRKHPKAEMVNLYVTVGNMRNLTQFVRMSDIREDRVFCDVCDNGGLVSQLDNLVLAGDLVQLPFDPVKAHHGDTALSSYRGRLPGGLMGDQWVLHNWGTQLSGTMEIPRYGLEFDIDEGSPVDVVGTFAHIVQVVRNKLRRRKSDPLAIAARLKEAGLPV